MSALSVLPDFNKIPSSTKRSIWSVTTEAEPSLIDSNKSPKGTAHKRWSQGLYLGVKWLMSKSFGNCILTPHCNSLRIKLGKRLHKIGRAPCRERRQTADDC